MNMKNLKLFAMIILAATMVGAAWMSWADDSTNAPVKVYPLKTCLVCGMELGMMGKPCVFVYQGHEIKVCNQSEKAEFDKNPKKYLKKLVDAEAKLKR
jgi:YHS domain-containing protein